VCILSRPLLVNMLAHLLLALSSQSFVCPPIEEARTARQAGEQCGGTCNSYGECAKGLECVEPQRSPMSFAILMGGTKAAGVCRTASQTVEAVPPAERRKLDSERRKLPGGMLAGGAHGSDVEDEAVRAAAKFGVSEIMARSNSLDTVTLTRIIDAQTQIVAGVKYTLTLQMSDNSVHRVQIWDQAWRTPRYQMMVDELVTLP